MPGKQICNLDWKPQISPLRYPGVAQWRSAVSLSVGSCNQFFRTLIGLDLQQFSNVDGRAEERV
jgi:hypothetical protein